MDYSTIIDAETWAFIRKTEDSYPPETATLGIAEQRALYDAMCAVFRKGYPDNVSAEDITAAGVPCRLYTTDSTPAATVVYFHGGGFVVGSLESHDDICAEICSRTGYRVISADYRLAPEHAHPAAFDDCLAVTQWVADTYGAPVVLAGDSAGANLSAAISHAARGTNVALAGQVLIYPALGLDLNAGSYLLHANAPMLSRSDVQFYRDIRFDGPPDDEDVRAWPLRDEDFVGLPPTFVVTAECDPLAEDGPAYVKELRAAGVPAICVEEPGLVHGYLRARNSVARARDSFERILFAIAAFGRGDWPFDT